LSKSPELSGNSKITLTEARDILYTLSPYHYITGLGFHPYEWQEAVLKSSHRRKIINGARQAGKSTIISAKPCHTAKYFPESVSLILASTEKQAELDMLKVREYMGRDPDYPRLVGASKSEAELANGSRIYIVAATETSARGYSKPRLIILDEASRIEDIVYTTGIMPMLTDNPECELCAISTPNGREGFFFKAFNNRKWERFEIRAPWRVKDVEFALTEAESEAAYRKRLAAAGIRGYYSPRHRNREEQEFNLLEMGPLAYRQEYGVEFVETDDQVFGYDEIARLMETQGEAIDLEGIGEGEAIEI